MQGYIYGKVAPSPEVKSLLVSPPAPVNYLLQESGSDIAFGFFGTPSEDWQPWLMGRAFGMEIEIRWQCREDGKFQLLILSESRWEDLAKGGWEERVMEAEEGGRIYLWGRHWSYLGKAEGQNTLHVWVQASIPRKLCYPLEARKEFAYVRTVDYYQDGMILLTRFQQVDGE